ncbi:Ger(x)C family spore germination protein [Aquibacillus saliphilus]|uniref:Ger(x)C family spore germination protein n=1 Tax=Aquibacillus saliphilus TaxID=1909422 RepID=UPI001CF0A621|nr:Ger(x)C family spore germination protein [Aquibacillus saliphilus]
MKQLHLGSLILFTILLAGCYDRTELEEQSYVIAIGVDLTDKNGLYKITFQIANPEVGTSMTGSGPDEPPRETVTVEGTDIISATATANSFVSKELKLDHTKVLVLSEKFARSGDLLRAIQVSSRTKQIRGGVQIIVSKEKARDFIDNNNPKMETRPHKYYQVMLNRASEIGIIPNTDIHRFFQITEGDADLFLAPYASTEIDEKPKENGTEDGYIAGEVPQEGGSRSQFMGSAVFKEGKMIDVLTGAETRIAQTLDNTIDLSDIYSTYEDPVDPNYRVAGAFAKKQNTAIKIDYKENGTTKIDVTVPFEMEIFAIPSLTNYSQNAKNREKLRKSIEDSLTKAAEDLVKKSQEKYETEPFYWSLYVRNNFKTIQEYEKADWNKKIFPHADITITYRLETLEFGKMIDDTHLNEVRD